MTMMTMIRYNYMKDKNKGINKTRKRGKRTRKIYNKIRVKKKRK